MLLCVFVVVDLSVVGCHDVCWFALLSLEGGCLSVVGCFSFACCY